MLSALWGYVSFFVVFVVAHYELNKEIKFVLNVSVFLKTHFFGKKI
jgi:hypothetical protein